MSFLRRAFSSGGSPQGGTMFAGSTLFDFVVPDKDGKDVSLACYKGKRCYLVVNVASQCGLTATNYAELSQLYEKHSSAGLEILAFPSNEFGAQEPGTNEEIQCFARDRGAKYPVFGKVKVNGKDALPLYQWLKSEKGGTLGDGIKWNFSKFLLDSHGRPVDRFSPTTSPMKIENGIIKLLSA